MVELVCTTCGKTFPATDAAGDPLVRCAGCNGLLILKTADPAPASKEPAPPAGTPFGKYTLNVELGRGSMGVVYDAHDTTLNRRVALKILHTTRTSDPKIILTEWQRFMQEARLSANVAKHSSIATVYEAAVHDGRRYIAMEFIRGASMNAWRRGIDRKEQIRLLRDVARALHHAHEAGIIHRDLKPGNVLVTGEGHPVVTDFGLATFERRNVSLSLTPAGFAVGSPGFMSPEQARGQKDVDRRTDVYSLGVMLYETIAGRQPFEGRTAIETLSKVIDGTKLPPSQVSKTEKTGDPVLDRICMKAMALDPKDRYPTAAAFAEELSRWLGEGTPAPRKPRIVLAAVAGLVFGLAGLVFWASSVMIYRHSRESARREAEWRAEVDKLKAAQAAPPPPPPAPRPLRVNLTAFRDLQQRRYNQVTSARLTFREPATFEATVTIPEGGDYEILAVAGCEEAKGEYAKFRTLVDGKDLGIIALTSLGQREYSIPARLAAGPRKISIEYVNDYYDAATKEDRNLFIHSLQFRKVK